MYQSDGPLSVYANIPVIEAANHSASSDFWRSLYPPMETITCHYTTFGLIENNTLVSLGDMTGNDEICEIENREPKADHDGFLDCYYTTQSKAAGRVRMLTAGVVIRVMTAKTLVMVKKILSCIRGQIGAVFGDWLVRCGRVHDLGLGDGHKEDAYGFG